MKFLSVLKESFATYAISNERNVGEMFIEFAVVNKGGKIYIPVIVKTTGNLGYMFSNEYPKKYKNLSDFIEDLNKNFGKKYGFNEHEKVPKKVKENVMDPDVLYNMINSIKKYATSLSNKNKSLTYDTSTKQPGEKNPSWDMHILFRKRIPDEKNPYPTYEPKVEYGSNLYGKPLGVDEVEKTDKKLKKFI